MIHVIIFCQQNSIFDLSSVTCVRIAKTLEQKLRIGLLLIFHSYTGALFSCARARSNITFTFMFKQRKH